MNAFRIALCALLFAPLPFLPSALGETGSEGDPGIDFERARGLLMRERAGESLTGEERAYLQRAREMRRAKGGAPGRADRRRDGGARRPAPERLAPLSDMGAEDDYEGEDGGLYGGGSNQPPPDHAAAAAEALAGIVPLDREGEPSPEGSIVLISISMSNATQEFSVFRRLAETSPLKSERVLVVDCAQGGQAMAEWADPQARPWEVARQRIEAAGASPLQVQTAWVKLANKAPSGSLEEHVGILESDTAKVLRSAREHFPNLRVAYLGSRTWGGYARSNLNPEPYAYESAFAVRRLIQRQAGGDPDLRPGAAAPLLLWGPYLWAEGERGRGDGLVWTREDFVGDGVHPSDSGREKVARLLLDFMTGDPLARGWFTGAE